MQDKPKYDPLRKIETEEEFNIIADRFKRRDSSKIDFYTAREQLKKQIIGSITEEDGLAICKAFGELKALIDKYPFVFNLSHYSDRGYQLFTSHELPPY